MGAADGAEPVRLRGERRPATRDAVGRVERRPTRPVPVRERDAPVARVEDARAVATPPHAIGAAQPALRVELELARHRSGLRGCGRPRAHGGDDEIGVDRAVGRRGDPVALAGAHDPLDAASAQESHAPLGERRLGDLLQQAAQPGERPRRDVDERDLVRRRERRRRFGSDQACADHRDPLSRRPLELLGDRRESLRRGDKMREIAVRRPAQRGGEDRLPTRAARRRRARRSSHRHRRRGASAAAGRQPVRARLSNSMPVSASVSASPSTGSRPVRRARLDIGGRSCGSPGPISATGRPWPARRFAHAKPATPLPTIVTRCAAAPAAVTPRRLRRAGS